MLNQLYKLHTPFTWAQLEINLITIEHKFWTPLRVPFPQVFYANFDKYAHVINHLEKITNLG